MWRIQPGQALRFRQFGDDIVLYNDLSGDTHLLGDTAMHLLSVLQQGPATRETLAASLAAALGCECDAAIVDEADAVLASLAGYFLIDRLPC
jgi:PqqD family protein of HPr-rel-A system